MNETLTTATRMERAADGGPSFVYHPDFEAAGAERTFDGPDDAAGRTQSAGHMIDEVTRATAKRMHYAAWRWRTAGKGRRADHWRRRYYHHRDQVVMGNHKLIFRAVNKRVPPSAHADDLIGDCQIVMIQAVAAYNPWLGIRFSTYAFTCLMRALSRLQQRQAADRLARALSLDVLPNGEPGGPETERPAAGGELQLDDYLREGHDLLSPREKTVIRRRFRLNDPERGGTLEQVGRELGLSKERVRQVQATALDKLRKALVGEPR